MATDRSAAVQSLNRTVSELARRWATQRLAAVQSYGRILSDYGSGRATGGDSARAYARLAAEEVVRYPSDAYAIASDYASAVARAAGLSSAADRSTATRSRVVDVELTGILGRVVTRTLVLENPHDAPATIGFTATKFHDGQDELTIGPSVTPADATIPASGEQAFKIGVKIDRKQFEAGRTYRSTIAVEGFDDMVIRVHLTVTGAT